MIRKPKVYIASPYTIGDPAINVHSSIKMFVHILKAGKVTPVCPLLSHFVHIYHPQHYDVWLEHCFQMLLDCDAVLRIPARCNEVNYDQWASRGADAEVDLAKANKIPVLFNVMEMETWYETTYISPPNDG